MKKNSIQKVLFISFISFALFIIFFLWIFQFLFTRTYYKYSKTKDIEKIVLYTKNHYNDLDFSNKLNEISLNKNICIDLTDSRGDIIYSSLFMGKGCISNVDTQKYRNNFISRNLREKVYRIINPMFKNNSLLYAVKLSASKYVFINTTLDPIDNSFILIRRQLILISIILLLMAFLVSFYIAHYISRPITELDDKAKKIAKGDFNNEFFEYPIVELNNLKNTLEYASKELSRADEVKRDLMANVSHDMKTPLTMIKAYALMSEEIHSNNKEKRCEDVKMIVDEVDRLTVLVNDILTLSSMQEASLKLDIQEFDLIELTKNIIDRFSLLKEEGFSFIFKYNKNKVLVKADKKIIDGVIYNLINNAINYTGNDKNIFIDVKANKEISFLVRDTGCGISDDDLPYIWDKYYKSKKNHKRNKYGTGLGLSIVKSALIAHDFKYGVKSNKDGTTFYFNIKK